MYSYKLIYLENKSVLSNNVKGFCMCRKCMCMCNILSPTCFYRKNFLWHPPFPMICKCYYLLALVQAEQSLAIKNDQRFT